MRFLLVMNPGSHSGRCRRRWTLWENGLRDAGINFRAARTGRIGDAFELARHADDCEAVVAVGGDGTVNEVLDGVIQSGRPRPAMGVLYAGTSPDFCRFHGIPTAPEAALNVLMHGHVRKVDVVKIAYHDAGGTRSVAHFGCSANIGMGAAVARHANRWRPFTGDSLGTACAAVRALVTSPRVNLELEIDGRTVFLPQTNNLTVAKNPFLASGLKLGLDIHPDDGRLCLVAVHGKGIGELCKALPRFYSGTVASVPGVVVRWCRSVTVRSGSVQEIEFDGDPRGYLPATIEILPRALNLIGDGHE